MRCKLFRGSFLSTFSCGHQLPSTSFTPRHFGEAERAELHHFADASEGHAHGTITYLCFVYKEGSIHNSFVIGKSEVRPKRSGISVPMTELTNATFLIMMGEQIKKELEGRIKMHMVKCKALSVWFCTDQNEKNQNEL